MDIAVGIPQFQAGHHISQSFIKGLPVFFEIFLRDFIQLPPVPLYPANGFPAFLSMRMRSFRASFAEDRAPLNAVNTFPDSIYPTMPPMSEPMTGSGINTAPAYMPAAAVDVAIPVSPSWAIHSEAVIFP